jgi:predicted PP-loop superfamily ATPase
MDIKRLINLKVQEFDYLFEQVKRFKSHLIKSVDFPEFGRCTNVVQMNRMLKIRKNEIDSLIYQA